MISEVAGFQYELSEVLSLVGSVPISTYKVEVEFFYDDHNEELIVSVKGHNPDGTYTETESWHFELMED